MRDVSAAPRYRGGLMFWADTVGSKAILDQINEWHERYGARWKPSNLLSEIAASNGRLMPLSPRPVNAAVLEQILQQAL